MRGCTKIRPARDKSHEAIVDLNEKEKNKINNKN